jgi:glutamate synthase domain-containing protein 2
MSHLTRQKILAYLLICLFASVTYAYFKHTPLSYIIIGVLSALLGLYTHDVFQKHHSILRNYPILGRLRWIFESERSKIQQYAIEDNINGTPINRERRSDIYQKAKKDPNTVPFGTQLNVYEKGYEFIKHNLYPIDFNTIKEPRFLIGSKFCAKPYCASIYNISAMSFGALSDAAVKALNGGAKLGNFYHNTGEGGLSPYHLEYGGDICFQIGTGYFGSGVDRDGKRYFDEKIFLDNAIKPQVKMIEIKLSQGAKPGHGGILPAAKNTEEISQIRNTTPGTDVMSPPYHTAFSNDVEMVQFIYRLRTLSGGKPIGIKLCLGDIEQFEKLVFTMKNMNCYPDFITLDGGEGGTGAAPLVFTNYVGTPLVDALIQVNTVLIKYGLRKDIKVIASGKATTSFDIVKLLALGADGVNAARAFMMSLGCIQARECNNNTCPVGIATQDKKLIRGLEPDEKRVRVFNFHENIIHEVRELMGAMGVDDVKKISANMICVRGNDGSVRTYNDIIKQYGNRFALTE